MNEWNNFNNDGYQTAVQAENEITLQRYVAGVMRKVYAGDRHHFLPAIVETSCNEPHIQLICINLDSFCR